MANSYRLRELKIEVNRECPLRCIHCSSNGEPHAPEKLELSRLTELIREFVEMGGETLAISGGEPLVYKGLPRILNVCHNLGIRPDFYTTGIYSNGVSLKPIPDNLLGFLIQSQAKVIFSLHGAQAKSHEALTQVSGSLDTTMRAMQRTLDAGISTEVHIVPVANNIGEIADMVGMLTSIGVKRVSWLRFVPQGRGKINRSLLQLTREQLRQLAHMRVKLQQKYPEMAIRTGSPFNILCPQSPTPCIAGISVLAVRPDGGIVPCDAFKQFNGCYEFSNILEHSLSEVWEKSELLNEVRKVLETKNDSLCASCPSYSRCNSGCLAQKAAAAGRITNGKDPDCLLERVEVDSEEIEAVPVY